MADDRTPMQNEQDIYIVMTGNPVDGLMFHGPFTNHDSALEFAELNSNPLADWWIAPLEAVSQ